MNRRTFVLVAIVTTMSLAAAAPIAAVQATPAPQPLSAAMKSETIATLLKLLQERYVFPEAAERAAADIRASENDNTYSNVTDGKQFADLLTAHLGAVCKDAHLRVRYSPTPLPPRVKRDRPTEEEARQEREMIRRTNAGFEKVERLAGNVGYLEFRGFMDPKAAARPVQAAMDFLADTDALIIDLRRNGGGSPDTVRLFCSYLFGSKPVHLNDLYFRSGNRTMQFWTLGRLPGKRYLDRDVFVLTSKRTGSGAEECAYNLQNLKRATIVGDTTWGGANPGDVYRLNERFEAFIPEGRAINPYTKTNWEGTGVQPDVRVASEQALKTAHAMAIKALMAKADSSDAREALGAALRTVEGG